MGYKMENKQLKEQPNKDKIIDFVHNQLFEDSKKKVDMLSQLEMLNKDNKIHTNHINNNILCMFETCMQSVACNIDSYHYNIVKKVKEDISSIETTINKLKNLPNIPTNDIIIGMEEELVNFKKFTNTP